MHSVVNAMGDWSLVPAELGAVDSSHSPRRCAVSFSISAYAFACVALLVVGTSTAAPPVEEKSTTDNPYGIERRQPWTTSRIVGSPEPPPPYEAVRAFPKLKFRAPVLITSAPGIDRLFVVERSGFIRTFPVNPDVEGTDVFVDLSEHRRHCGSIYGLTFHPRFAENGLVYICYVGAEPYDTYVSEFRMAQLDPPVCDIESERVLLTYRPGGHNGGCLKFGPDGYLYITTGDAESPFPPDGLDTGQDNSDLLSSILRIDVDRAEEGRAYRIPPDNPFVGLEDTRPEIYAYGFRNPWKMSFDPVRGHLWVGDVGWELYEMIYRIVPGGNYGWSIMEGPQPVRPDAQRGPTPILSPTVAHAHSESRSITGGHVYYGHRLKDLVGAYVYGDYESGKIWALRYDGEAVTWHKEIAQTTVRISAFGKDQSGELYIADHSRGGLFELRPNRLGGYEKEFPRRLSETGLFASLEKLTPATGVFPYSIAVEPWADYAVASRAIAIPGDGHAVGSDNAAGKWSFPEGSVLVKTLSLPMEQGNPKSLRRIETQLLQRAGEAWNAYSYEWNEEQTDATLVDSQGANREYNIIDATAPGGRRMQPWRFYGRVECLICHNTSAGYTLGMRSPQLNVEQDYDGIRDNQLRTLQHIGVLSTSQNEKRAGLGGRPPLPDPYDESLPVNVRTRSYLDANCAHCHSRHNGGTAVVEFPFNHTLKETRALGARPSLGTFGLDAPHIVYPGDPYRSVLFYRMSTHSAARMPRLGSRTVDPRGVDLIYRWIRELSVEEAPDADQESSRDLSTTVHARSEALAQLENAGSSLDTRNEALESLFTSTSGALAVLRRLDEGALRAELEQEVIDRAASHPSVDVRTLYTRFVAEEERVVTLGADFDLAAILSLKGNAQRGEELFRSEGGVQCKSCHAVDGQSDSLGPSLAGISKKYTRTQVLESIVDPSKRVDPKYVLYLLVTTAGEVHNGILVERTADSIVLKNNKSEPIKVATGNVAALTSQPTSIMPRELLRDLTAQQAADLLEFLMATVEVPKTAALPSAGVPE